MKKWISSEYQECLAYFKWAQFHPILKEYLIKIVNEGKRTQAHGFALQRIGLRAGVPDYFLPVPNEKHCGLWIEMKTIQVKNEPKNENQNKWIAKLEKVGHYATYCYGWQEAAQVTMQYLDNKI